MSLTETSVPSVTWENPPKRTGRGPSSKWLPILQTFREHPLQWGKVEILVPAQTAYQIKTGKLGGARKGEFEARSQSPAEPHDKKYVELWVCYMGDDSNVTSNEA